MALLWVTASFLKQAWTEQCDCLFQILSSPLSRREHGYDAVVLLALLVNYRKYEVGVLGDRNITSLYLINLEWPLDYEGSAHCSIRASAWSCRSFARQPCYDPCVCLWCMCIIKCVWYSYSLFHASMKETTEGICISFVEIVWGRSFWKSCCAKPRLPLCVCMSVWLYIISKVKWAVSHPGLQTEFVIQNLTSWLKEHRSPEEMVKLWPKNELKHHS